MAARLTSFPGKRSWDSNKPVHNMDRGSPIFHWGRRRLVYTPLTREVLNTIQDDTLSLMKQREELNTQLTRSVWRIVLKPEDVCSRRGLLKRQIKLQAQEGRHLRKLTEDLYEQERLYILSPSTSAAQDIAFFRTLTERFRQNLQPPKELGELPYSRWLKSVSGSSEEISTFDHPRLNQPHSIESFHTDTGKKSQQSANFAQNSSNEADIVGQGNLRNVGFSERHDLDQVRNSKSDFGEVH